MKKSIVQKSLEILLVILNVGFIVFTLKQQGIVELAYNLIVILLNISYYGLQLFPDDE